jgi:hypothetical protein
MKFLMKIKELFDKAGKLAWDFVTDKNNDGDEKRVLGIASVILGMVYGFQANSNPQVLWAYLIFGGVLLGVAAFTDKIPKP